MINMFLNVRLKEYMQYYTKIKDHIIIFFSNSLFNVKMSMFTFVTESKKITPNLPWIEDFYISPKNESIWKYTQ